MTPWFLKQQKEAEKDTEPSVILRESRRIGMTEESQVSHKNRGSEGRTYRDQMAAICVGFFAEPVLSDAEGAQNDITVTGSRWPATSLG